MPYPVAALPRTNQSRCSSLAIDQQESPSSGRKASRYTIAAIRSGRRSATAVMTEPA